MAQLVVHKRDGKQVPFEASRIAAAVAKAYDAAGVSKEENRFDEVVDAIVESVRESFTETSPGVEEIQDLVERHLVGHGLYEVSKRYILYREERRQRREALRQERIRLAGAGKLSVTKRSGKKEAFNYANLEATLNRAAAGIEEHVSLDLVLRESSKTLFDDMGTDQVEQNLILATTAFIERDPAYNTLAARLLRQKLYRETFGRSVDEAGFDAVYRRAFVDTIRRGVEGGVFDPTLGTFDLDALAEQLIPERDDMLTYLGTQTLFERYFVRIDGHVAETPQSFWMRVSMGLSIREENPVARAVQFYGELSNLRFVASTPTLFHSGLTHPQLSSCYLSTVKDDLSHIFKVIADNAQLSKWSGGIGNDWTSIRGTGALIKSTQVDSQGVVPFLKIANDTTVAINRSGKRRGATCAYLETWHLDIEEFLDLRRNTGDDRRRTHDMNTANWIPDLFMKRVKADGTWTLFSPDEVPDLHETYGKNFETRYLEYERLAREGKIHKWKEVEALKLWRKMLTRLFETGHPWITFKDPSNIRSPQDHAGVIHNSNLCTEITLNNSEDETAVCNLGSINLARHVGPEGINPDTIGATIRTAMRMLDNVIDINYYPTEEARRSNMRHRPVGLGVMGFQDALFTVRYPMDSPDAVDFVDEVMELISYNAILASSELAAERGAYESYKGSKWDRGIFPIDTLDILEAERGEKVQVNRKSRLDWAPVRDHVAKHGMRNSNTMAIAPTATISNIAGCFPCIEPIYKNLYVKSNMSGEFTIVNEYLVRDLKERGLWGDATLDQLKYYDGNVSLMEDVPEELKGLYKEAFDIDAVELLHLTAVRSKWIDQSQSHNVFIRGSSGKKLHDTYMAAWEMGLKTTYYLRSLGASQIEKSTLDAKKYGFTQKRQYQGAGNAAGAEAGAGEPGSTPEPLIADGAPAPTTPPSAHSGQASSPAHAGSAGPASPSGADSTTFVAKTMPATEVTSICSLTDPDCEACQ